MFMMTLRFLSPEPGPFSSPESFQTRLSDCVLPEDAIEQIHVQASCGGRLDVVFFLSVPDLAAAQVNGTAFCSRLLSGELRGWQLSQAWLERPA
jgi:hypothetical protein